jgi:ubiquinol-cytochrome c reductase iron-sulfur subunit
MANKKALASEKKDDLRSSDHSLESADLEGGTLDATSRRDFMVLTASAMAGVGAACALVPLVDSMNPSADVLAMGSIEVDISQIAEGSTTTVKWRGKPVFIRHRTAEEIAAMQSTDLTTLKDPAADADRVKPGKEAWLITVGVCTHLGCVPLTNQEGWFCPCHGSGYDRSGRVLYGPAPHNLPVPPYEFIADTKIRIG